MAFADEFGTAQAVGADKLAAILRDHRTLRLAVLNACEGARAGQADLFAGTAQTLTRQGVPAVVAMQFPVTDGAAIAFAEGFYEAVAVDTRPLDAATTTGRLRMLTGPDTTEWATPVLCTAAADTRVFTMAPSRLPEVIAWGSNDVGRVHVPADLSSVVAVAAGDFHSLALTSAGRVVVWGEHERPAPWLSGVAAIAAGGRHSLALMNGRVVAWGSGLAGQCRVPTDLGACVAVAAGGAHSLALTTGGTVRAWGSDEDHQCRAPANLTDRRGHRRGQTPKDSAWP